MTDRSAEPRDVRHTAFVTVVAAFLVFLYLFSPFTSVFLGWFVEFEDNISHKVHEVTFGLLFSIIFVGVLAQLRAATRSFAGALMALVAAISLSVIVTLTTGWEWPTLMYLVPLAAVAWLHPDRKEFFRFKLQPNLPALVMVLLVAAPLLDAMAREVDKAANEVRGHQSHWAGMATFAITLLIIGLLSALRVHRWPLLTWTTGISIALYGVLSLAYPFDASARPGVPAVLAILWSAVFIFVSRAARPVPAVRRGSDSDIAGARPALPLWQKAVLVLGGLAVFVIGGAISSTARSFSPPPVPHTLESRSSVSCLDCHSNGELSAPVIDWRWHPYTETPRAAPPICSSCHDLPPLPTASAVPVDHPTVYSQATTAGVDGAELRELIRILERNTGNR